MKTQAKSPSSPWDATPELVKAQFIALSRRLPLAYVVLLANSWVLAWVYWSDAPPALVLGPPAVLSVLGVLRTLFWLRVRSLPSAATDGLAVGHQRRVTVVAVILTVALVLWCTALHPYGSGYQQAQILLYLALSVIVSMFCLIHAKVAAGLVAVIGGGAAVVFALRSGNPAFIATAVNLALAIGVAAAIVRIQNRDFSRMIGAQIDARRLEAGQIRPMRMVDEMPIAVVTADPETFEITYMNDATRALLKRIEDFLPVSADDVLGSSIDLFHRIPLRQHRLLADPANLPHRGRIRVGPEVLDFQVDAITGEDGSYLGPMLVWEIVTAQVAAEDHIRKLAHYDQLTMLANRTTLQNQIEQALADPAQNLALLFIDLDDFKLVNDTRGHGVGDAVLRQVADRLRTVCVADDTSVSRFGGDEFTVLIDRGDRFRAETLAWEIVSALNAPYWLDDEHQLHIGASIGVALAPEHGIDTRTLLSRADLALFAAKAAGRSTVRVFEPVLESQIRDRVALETELRAALDDPVGLFVFYQPTVDVASGRVTAREALLRWHHPARGWIPPSEFIPVAEQSSLIDRLGRFVLDHACREAMTWDDDARVSVNVSAAQLGNETLSPSVRAALDESGLPADRLELEVTETALLRNRREAISDLQRIHDLGVRVALDDFGTGYSSLAHLRAFPFDKIKIDGTFVRDAVTRADCAAVVRAIVELGDRLGVAVVAECVETQAQLAQVSREGCREVQGYLFGRPAPAGNDAIAVGALNSGGLSAWAELGTV